MRILVAGLIVVILAIAGAVIYAQYSFIPEEQIEHKALCEAKGLKPAWVLNARSRFQSIRYCVDKEGRMYWPYPPVD